MSESRNRAINKQHKSDRLDDELMAKEIMSTPRGRRWMWRFMERCALYHESEHFEPMRLAFEKGQRSIGFPYLNDISRFTPNEYIQMTTEATNVQLRLNTEEDSANDD